MKHTRKQIYASPFTNCPREALIKTKSHFLGQAGCSFTGTVDDVVSQLIAFFKGLGTEPLTVTQTDGRTGRMDAATAFNHAQNLWLARPEYWPALTRALSAAMTRHDGTELARVGACPCRPLSNSSSPLLLSCG